MNRDRSDASDHEPTKVLVLDKLAPAGVELIEREPGLHVEVKHGLTGAALEEALKDAEAVLVRSETKLTAPLIAKAERLRVIGRAGIGVDNIDVKAATARGVLVMNSPDANANTTAEHALALIFSLARNVPAADRSVREGKWERAKFIGAELAGKTLGVLGGGNIGRRVAVKAKALGLEVIVHDPFLPANALDDVGIPVVPIERFVAASDFVTIHVPLLDSTRNFVDAAFLAKTKRGVRIINCARGGIVNEADLAAAIVSGQVAGAALDVFASEPPPKDHPLFASERVVLTPHLGASTTEAQHQASVEICRQVLAYLVDGEVKNAVNLPRVAPSVLAELEPWLDLAARLGMLLAAKLGGPCEALEVSVSGRLAERDTALVTRALIAGLLAHAFDEPVNLVNAAALAAARGMRVEEKKSERIRDFASMLSARAFSGATVATVGGTLFGHRQPRFVRVDGHAIEVIPEGPLLVLKNDDRPGVVGRVGSLLGDAGVNIRAMHLSPPATSGGAGDSALAFLNVQSPPHAEVLAQIRRLPEVRSLDLVLLPEGRIRW